MLFTPRCPCASVASEWSGDAVSEGIFPSLLSLRILRPQQEPRATARKQEQRTLIETHIKDVS